MKYSGRGNPFMMLWILRAISSLLLERSGICDKVEAGLEYLLLFLYQHMRGGEAVVTLGKTTDPMIELEKSVAV